MRSWMNITSLLLEGSLSQKYAYRSWYNPDTRAWVEVGPFSSHSRTVMSEPESFGLTADDLAGATTQDQDKVVMAAACDKGWIRVASQSRQDPSKCMMFEGGDMKALLALLQRFFADQRATMQNAIIKHRREGGTAAEYALIGTDTIKQAFQRNELPPARMTDKNESLVESYKRLLKR